MENKDTQSSVRKTSLSKTKVDSKISPAEQDINTYQ